MKKSKTRTKPGLTELEVREVVDQLLREAFRDQGRTLEEHFKDVNKRLVVLEKR